MHALGHARHAMLDMQYSTGHLCSLNMLGLCRQHI